MASIHGLSQIFEGLAFDQVITGAEAPQVQPPKQLIYIPAIALLALLIVLQRRRRKEEPVAQPAAA